MRIAVVTVHESWSDDKPTYRLCEADGTVCINWLPGLEPNDPAGPLDRGGFDQRNDALSFALGVDRERALFGLLPGLTAEDIDIERHAMDSGARCNALDRMDAALQLDFNALLDAVDPPVMEHRRRRVA